MAIISEIKCARCDRMYSGVRSRCPYCGARRIGRGKYSEDSDNSRGKMLITVLIMAVLTVGCGVLLFTTDTGEPDASAGNGSSIEVPDDSGTNSEDGIHDVPEPTEEPTEDIGEPVATEPKITFIEIQYDRKKTEDFTVRIGEKIGLRVYIEPPGLDVDIIWTSSDESVFSVIPAPGVYGGAQVTGTGVSRSGAILTVTVGDMEATCIVRGRS